MVCSSRPSLGLLSPHTAGPHRGVVLAPAGAAADVAVGGPAPSVAIPLHHDAPDSFLVHFPGGAGRSHLCHSPGLVHRFRSALPRPQPAGCRRARAGFSPVFRMFFPLHEGCSGGFFRWVFWGRSGAFPVGIFGPKCLLTDYFGPKVVAHFHFWGGAIFSLFSPATFFVICAVAV